jgi:hypothetical protein
MVTHLSISQKRDAAGFMPRGSQFGYIFTKDFSSDKEILQTIAHELGHGRLLLKHTFDKDYKLPQAGTDNLMDYTPLATHLAKWQWDLASDPGIAQGVFDKDEDGMMVIFPCGAPKPINKGTFEGESKIIKGTYNCEKTWYHHMGMEIMGQVSEAGWYEIDDYLQIIKRPLTGLMYIQIQEEIRNEPPDEISRLKLLYGSDTLDIYRIKDEVYVFQNFVASDSFDEDFFDALYEAHADKIFQLYARESQNAHKNVTGKIESISPEFDLAALGIGAVVKKATVGLTKAAIKRLSVKEFTNLFRKTATKVETFALKPLGLGSTGRTTAENLTEELAMKEIMSNPSAGKILIQKMNDVSGRWHGWSKMSNKTSHGVEIHYNALWEDGIIKAIDDFKFVSP